MDSLELACAQLAAAAYRELVDAANRIEPLISAHRLPGALGYRKENGLSGFEASAFEYDGKIIIAYTGTNPDQKSDLLTNAFLALGGTHPQLNQAAEFYQAIRNDPAYAGKEIVFTGHSLGGGLAAVMRAFFNKRAITFDPAPFRLVATQENAVKVGAYLTSTHPEWPVDADLSGYYSTNGIVSLHAPLLAGSIAAVVGVFNPRLAATILTLPFPIVIRGEGNISAFSVSGEFLTAGYKNLAPADMNTLRIQAGSVPGNIEINPAGAKLGAFDLHSMKLLIAAANLDAWRVAA